MSRPSADLRVMTFNLRCASGEREEHAWPLRRPVVSRLLRQEAPEVLGTQEGLPHQLREIRADLPAYYDSIGEGREADGGGEAMEVYFDTRRLRPLEHGHYWLSDTPDIAGSRSWGGDWPRMVTWVRFRDQRTGSELCVINTHLEAHDATARAKSPGLVLRRMHEDVDPGVPVLLTGDLNEPAAVGQTVYDGLVTDGPFVDTWLTAGERSAGYGTFHDYGPLAADGDRIDWILATPDVRVRSAAVNTFQVGDAFPSDHLPVQAVLALPGA